MEAFKQLIEPNSISDFVKNNWCKTPLLIVKDSELNNLVNLEEINDYLSNQRISAPFIRIVKDGKPLEPALYVDDRSGDYNIIDKKKMFALMANGSTLVIQASHLTFPKLKSFSEKLEMELGVRMHANIYITPANAKGFHPHLDAHEVFVLQLSGKKNWNIYDKPYSSFPKTFHLPEDKQKEYLAIKPIHELLLQEGDVLYIPRGVVHDAYTANTHSIHITFGFHPLERIDVLRSLVDNAANEPFFCEYMFPTFDEFDQQVVIEEMKTKLASGLSKANLFLESERNRNKKKFEKTPDFFLDMLVIENVSQLEDLTDMEFIVDSHAAIELNESETTVIGFIQSKSFQSDQSAFTIDEFKSIAKSLVMKGYLKVA